MLIAVCGTDGSGKTTQIENIEKFLMKKGKKVYRTKQPTDWYRKDERVRRFLKGEIEDAELIKELALFSAADRLRHINEEIIPKIKEGYIVLTDRYVFSAYAYFYTRGIKDIEWLKNINKYVLEPDITLYIKTDPKIAYERILKRDGKSAKKEEKDINFLNKVAEVFEKQIWGYSNKYHIINGNNEIKNVETDILDIIKLKVK